MPCDHAICKRRREVRNSEFDELKKVFRRGDFNYETRSKVNTALEGNHDLSTPGLSAMELKTPVDFLERIILNFRFAIGSFDLDDEILHVPEPACISPEDATYLMELKDVVQNYPEQSWLVKKLMQFVMLGQAVCDKYRHEKAENERLSMGATPEARLNCRSLHLL